VGEEGRGSRAPRVDSIERVGGLAPAPRKAGLAGWGRSAPGALLRSLPPGTGIPSPRGVGDASYSAWGSEGWNGVGERTLSEVPKPSRFIPEPSPCHHQPPPPPFVLQ
jgi:hypothetical protein